MPATASRSPLSPSASPSSSPPVRRLLYAVKLKLVLQATVLFFVCFRCDTDATSSYASSPGSCPKTCFCNPLSKIVYCSRRGMSAIPDGIAADTLQLNLNGNTFQTTAATRANFSRYAKLEHLYLSECGIEMLDVDTFADLTNLKWLDLSNNRLRVIMQYTFRGLTLEHLFLNGNRNIQLLPGSFDGLLATGLYLHDCSLKFLKPEVLESLNDTLRNLWLNGNELERLDKTFSAMFYNFQHLHLGSNPLHCGCEAVWLKEFYDKNGEVFKSASIPSCFAPARLKGKYFNELSLFDFRCQSPVFSNIDIMFNETVGRLKCSASGDPTPTLFWIQPTGKTTKHAPPAPEDSSPSRRNEAVLVLHPVNVLPETAGMTGMYICVANNEAGNVTLAVNVSWPTSKANVHHHHHHHPHPSSSSSEVVLPPAGVVSAPPGIASEENEEAERYPVGGARGNVSGHVTSTIASERVALRMTSVYGREGDGGEREGGSEDGFHGSGDDGDVDAASPDHDAPTSHLTRTSGVIATHRMFSVTELVCAVVVTHLCTLMASVVFVGVFYYRRRSKMLLQQQLLPTNDVYRQPLHGLVHHKPPDSPYASVDHDESLYRNHAGSSLYHKAMHPGCTRMPIQ